MQYKLREVSLDARFGLGPSYVELGETLGSWFEELFEPVFAYGTPGESGEANQSLERAVASMSRVPPARQNFFHLDSALVGERRGSRAGLELRVGYSYDAASTPIGRHLTLFYHTDSTIGRPIPERYYPAFLEFTRRLVAKGWCASARMDTSTEHAAWVIRPPIADRNLMVVTTREEIAKNYVDVDAFIAGWEGAEWLGDRVMLTRGMGCQYELQWLARVGLRNYDLVRLAQPKVTRYPVGLRVTPEAKPFLDNPPERLVRIGYHVELRALAYTCFPGPGEHLSPRDIWFLTLQTQEHIDWDDKPVNEVRVYFYTEAAARAESRVLLDLGVRVFFEDPDGNPAGVEIVE